MIGVGQLTRPERFRQGYSCSVPSPTFLMDQGLFGKRIRVSRTFPERGLHIGLSLPDLCRAPTALSLGHAQADTPNSSSTTALPSAALSDWNTLL